jgi:hypothetical protein
VGSGLSGHTTTGNTGRPSSGEIFFIRAVRPRSGPDQVALQR